MKQRGKYGSPDTVIDEAYSVECAQEIYLYLTNNKPISGYSYCYLDKGVDESLYYKRDMGPNYPIDFISHKIETDVPTIILRNNLNPREWYLVLSGDDKYQETNGNAIERLGKNYTVAFEKMCYNSEICPYVLLCSGISFVNDDGSPNTYFASKFREMLPYTHNEQVHIWDVSKKHNSYKKTWNRLYVKRERFTREEKMEILKSTANEAVEYLKEKLQTKPKQKAGFFTKIFRLFK